MRLRKPSLPSTLAFMLPIALFLIAAHWQWRRAEFKDARAAEFAAAVAAPDARRLRDALAAPRAGAERISIDGTLDRDRLVLLDNRIRDGRYGVDVYAPLRSDDGAEVLVGFGWVAGDASRRTAPVIPPLPASIHGKALLTDPPAAGLRLGTDADAAAAAKFPLMVSRIDIASLRARLQCPGLAERVVIPEPDVSSGFVRDWHLPGIGADRHRGYALQWLSFAIGTLVFFFLWHRPRKASSP
jgi:surfeit locus 1 family protein